jgi:hypothetical protein
MKKSLWLLSITALLMTIGFTSCTEDGTLPGLVNSPSIRLLDGTGYISSSTTAIVGETLAFQVSAEAGETH